MYNLAKIKMNTFLIVLLFSCAESSLLRRLFSSCSKQGPLFAGVCRILIKVASLVWGTAVDARASVVVACGSVVAVPRP